MNEADMAAESKKEPKAPAEPKKDSKNGEGGGGGNGKKKVSRSELLQYLLKKKGIAPVKPSFTQLPHVPSGSIVVDNLLGGSKSGDGKGAVCPGFPRKRITELYGAEASGKTTMALSAVVQAQKAGGYVVYIDFEHALMDAYARKVGVVYNDSLDIYRPTTFEEGADIIEKAIQVGADLIVVDSVANMMTKDEYEKGADESERIGALAGPLTRLLKKLVVWLDHGAVKKELNPKGTAMIFINQTRAKISTGYGGGHGGEEDQTPGGKALKFYASLRLRMTRIKSEVVKKKGPDGKEKSIPYGNVTSVKVVKTKIDNKMGQEGLVFIRFGYGIDNVMAVIENGVNFKLVKKDGAAYGYGATKFRGRESFRKYLLENPKEFAALQAKVVAAMFESATDSVTEDEAPPDEDEAILQEIEGAADDAAAFSSNEADAEEADVTDDNDGNTSDVEA